MKYLYVLKLENNALYIGTTSNIEERFKQHSQGKIAVWTKNNKPVAILDTIAFDKITPHDLRIEAAILTHKYMKKYGVQNIRGELYPQVHFTETRTKNLTEFIDSDKCYRCNLTGHHTNACPKFPVNHPQLVKKIL